MALTEFDQKLLQRCLEHDKEAWKEFIDRFLGVFYHVVRHTANIRSVIIEKEAIEDLCADIVSHIIADDYKVLRKFRGKASLASYLAVVARRVTVHYLLRKSAIQQRRTQKQMDQIAAPSDDEIKIDNHEEVQYLLSHLQGRDADLVRAFYIDRKSYEQISQEFNIAANSVGPTLSRIRRQLRESAKN